MGGVVMNGIEQFLVKHGSAISTFEYLAVIVAVSFLECIIPRRRSGDALRLRWFGNITIDILGLITTGLIFPVVGFGFALRCAERGWGLLNRISLPLWSEFILTFLILDIAAYGQHYLFHRVPVLW